jgi:Leucine-rich repeat (LRR) protein
VRVRPDMVDLKAHTGLVALPEELRACAGRVRALAVRSKRLEALPAWLGELTGLTGLRVGGWWANAYNAVNRWYDCPLRELPKEVGQLTRLQTLDLSFCSGLTAPPAGLGALTGLRELYLSECSGLTVMPEGIGALKGLRELYLSGCSGLTALPAELGALTGMQELVLSLCDGLTVLPAGLWALTGLRELVLPFCDGLAALPAELGALTGLRKLVLSLCSGLTALPAELGALTRLQELYLAFCDGLTALPAGLGALTSLLELDLSRCSGLTALPAELGALTGMRELGLACLALHTPPPRVVDAGTDAVLAFLRDLGGGSAPCHLIKLVLLGEKRAGKSSLADSLVRGRPTTRHAGTRAGRNQAADARRGRGHAAGRAGIRH